VNLADYLAQLERRAAEAEVIGSTAPLAGLFRAVLAELRPLAGGNITAVSERPPDRMLTAAQVAKILEVSVRWVYDHKQELGGKRLSRRCLRFSETTVRRYLERRR
jgi:hypothetical protein